MTRRRALSTAGILVVAVVAELPAQAPPQFRTTVTGVAVPVTVRSRGAAVQGLTAQDFALFDAGVLQEIVAVDAATLPLDLTIVAQETFRTSGYGFDTFEDEIAGVAASRRPGDRLTVRFAARDQRALAPPLRPGAQDVRLERQCIPVYDTLARALMEPTQPDRQRVVVLIAIGEGRGGFLSTRAVREIATRANARLYVVSVAPVSKLTFYRSYVANAMCPHPGVNWSRDRQERLWFISQMKYPFDQFRRLDTDGTNRLVEIAELTGGREVRPTILTQGTTGPLREVLDEARGSYVLRYTPNGTPEPGWHPVEVKIVREGRYDLRVRPGYQR